MVAVAVVAILLTADMMRRRWRERSLKAAEYAAEAKSWSDDSAKVEKMMVKPRSQSDTASRQRLAELGGVARNYRDHERSNRELAYQYARAAARPWLPSRSTRHEMSEECRGKRAIPVHRLPRALATTLGICSPRRSLATMLPWGPMRKTAGEFQRSSRHPGRAHARRTPPQQFQTPMRRRESTDARRTRPQTGTLQQGLDGEAVPDTMLPPSPWATDGCLQSFRTMQRFSGTSPENRESYRG